MGVCGAKRSQKLVKSLVKAAFRGEPLFRPSRPDSIETERFGLRGDSSWARIVPAF